jgi:hypothetical protein
LPACEQPKDGQCDIGNEGPGGRVRTTFYVDVPDLQAAAVPRGGGCNPIQGLVKENAQLSRRQS